MKNRIVVGYDGSASSVAASHWAATEAEIRHARLTILSCATTPVGVEWSASRCAELGTAASMAHALRNSRHNLDCDSIDDPSSPREALIAASVDADLVVVGRTGAGAAKAMLMGSVSHAVVRRSQCPCVVVPQPAKQGPVNGLVVVGVDGSPTSDAALSWAVCEAAVRGAALRIVLAWTYTSSGPASEWEKAHDAARAQAQSLLHRLLSAARAQAGERLVHGLLVEAPAEAALVAQSDSADLLVVGSRGRGGLRSVVFGSVARAVTDNAVCPTVVVHPPAQRH